MNGLQVWWMPTTEWASYYLTPELITIVGVLAIINIIAIIWALVDISHSKGDVGYKLIWAFLCIVFGIIGAIIYYFSEKYTKPSIPRRK